MIVDARALDADVGCDFAKAEATKTTDADSPFRCIHDRISDFTHRPQCSPPTYLSIDYHGACTEGELPLSRADSAQPPAFSTRFVEAGNFSSIGAGRMG